MGSSKNTKSSKKSGGMAKSPAVKGAHEARPAEDKQFEKSPDHGRARSAYKRQRYDQIGRELRDMFKEIVNEPIPTDLMDLLEKLDEQSQEGGEKKN